MTSMNFILFLFLFLRGSHSIDSSGSNNILEITQHISNTIISYDKELNDHNSLQMKSNHHYNDYHVSFHLDISDKAKLLSMEESTHGKVFNFESFDSAADYDRNHHQQPQQLQQYQQHHSDLITENNYNIRFNHRRQLMNNIQNNIPVDKRRKSKRKV